MGKRILFIPHNRLETWLNKKIYESKYVYLDNWSYVHAGSGFLLGWILTNYFNVAHPFLTVLGLLVAYEIFEMVLWDKWFKRESLKNIYYDIKLGILGWWTYYWFFVRL